ncbi:MAG: adenylate/guanylate cyclase domain-containing protein [Chromatiales bacterium]|nr:adenylate/guanylate cyclase domain-containing protein [Chromatiales bacterium]
MHKESLHRPPHRRTIFLVSGGISLVLFLLLAFTYRIEPQLLSDIEGRLLDARFKLRGPISTSGAVAIVAVDEKSIEEIGRWPWSREVIAELIEKIGGMGAGAIGLDIVFSEPQSSPLDELLSQRSEIGIVEQDRLRRMFAGESPDQRLARVIGESGRVVNGQFFYLNMAQAKNLKPLPPEQERDLLADSGVDAVRSRVDNYPAIDAVAVRMNIPLIGSAGNGAGYFNFRPGRDGVLREASLLLRYKGEFYPSLALKTLATFLDDAAIVVHADEFGVEKLTLGGMEIPTDETGGFVLNYRGPRDTITTYSASDILKGRVTAEALAERMVLLGVTAIGVYDAHTSPFGAGFPGLEIQANVAENIIIGDYIHHTAMEWLTDIAVIFVILLLLALTQPLFNGIRLRFFSAVSILLLYGVLNYYLFSEQQLWINLTYPLLAWMLGSMALTVFLTVVVERRLSTVNTAFQYYLHPELVKQLTHKPELLQFGGEEKRLSILFSDIRNFTNLSEGLTPPQLAKFIHCYMDPMTEQVLNHRGTLDKYIGDAVMAIFGAPIPVENHAIDACNSALDMIAALDNVEQCCPELAHIFPIRIGVGIHTGNVVVGNLGSSFHFTYTALGDNVNLASRLEGITKTYGVSVLISEETRNAIGDHFLVRELDRVRVKGKQIPIKVFEVIARSEQASEGQCDFVSLWEAALALFHSQQWHQAHESFATLLQQRGEERASALYLERCEYYQQHPPPEDWDGVTTFTTK